VIEKKTKKEPNIVWFVSVFLCLCQSLYLWMSLSFARDEFQWLLRHAENVPQKKSAATKAEDYVDR